MSFFVRAATLALQEYPIVNSVIDGNEIVRRNYVDISVAVATPTGLLVPVLRNCQNMKFQDIEIVNLIFNLGNRWISQERKGRKDFSWRHARWFIHHFKRWNIRIFDGNPNHQPSTKCHFGNARYRQQTSRQRKWNRFKTNDVFGLDLRP